MVKTDFPAPLILMIPNLRANLPTQSQMYVLPTISMPLLGSHLLLIFYYLLTFLTLFNYQCQLMFPNKCFTSYLSGYSCSGMDRDRRRRSRTEDDDTRRARDVRFDLLLDEIIRLRQSDRARARSRSRSPLPRNPSPPPPPPATPPPSTSAPAAAAPELIQLSDDDDVQIHASPALISEMQGHDTQENSPAPAAQPDQEGDQIIQVTAYDNGRLVTINTPADNVGTSVLNVLNAQDSHLVMSDHPPRDITQGPSYDTRIGLSSRAARNRATQPNINPPRETLRVGGGGPRPPTPNPRASHPTRAARYLATPPNSNPIRGTPQMGGSGANPPTLPQFGPMPAAHLVRYHDDIRVWVNPDANGSDVQRALSQSLIYQLHFSLGDVKRAFGTYLPCNNYQVGTCNWSDFSHPSHSHPFGRWFTHICRICYIRAKLPFHHNLSTCPFVSRTPFDTNP